MKQVSARQATNNKDMTSLSPRFSDVVMSKGRRAKCKSSNAAQKVQMQQDDH